MNPSERDYDDDGCSGYADPRDEQNERRVW